MRSGALKTILKYILSILCDHLLIILFFFLYVSHYSVLSVIYSLLTVILMFSMKLKLGYHGLWIFMLKVNIIVVIILYLTNIGFQISYLAGVFFIFYFRLIHHHYLIQKYLVLKKLIIFHYLLLILLFHHLLSHYQLVVILLKRMKIIIIKMLYKIIQL